MKQGGVGKGPIQTMGIRRYLDSTSDLHNGNGYDDFERMVKVTKPNIAKIARDMNISSREAVYRWAKVAGITIKRIKGRAAHASVEEPTPDTSEEKVETTTPKPEDKGWV
jgi:hypothetical protein